MQGGQNTGHDNPCNRDSEDGGWLKEFLVSEMNQKIVKRIACNIEVGGATLESDDLDSNQWHAGKCITTTLPEKTKT